MSFNASKCNSTTITRKRKILHDYLLYDTVLERIEAATYPGVELTLKLTWTIHIYKMCAKADNGQSWNTAHQWGIHMNRSTST